jgi:alkaline phosphatase
VIWWSFGFSLSTNNPKNQMKTTSLFIAFILFSFSFQPVSAQKKPRNVIFLIGDGMGIAQIYAGMVANGNSLQLERCTFSGFSKTYSANNFTTDSGAGGTALACGVKTKNGMIGMSPDSVSVASILELSKKKQTIDGLSSCLFSDTCYSGFIYRTSG